MINLIIFVTLQYTTDIKICYNIRISTPTNCDKMPYVMLLHLCDQVYENNNIALK